MEQILLDVVVGKQYNHKQLILESPPCLSIFTARSRARYWINVGHIHQRDTNRISANNIRTIQITTQRAGIKGVQSPISNPWLHRNIQEVCHHHNELTAMPYMHQSLTSTPTHMHLSQLPNTAPPTYDGLPLVYLSQQDHHGGVLGYHLQQTLREVIVHFLHTKKQGRKTSSCIGRRTKNFFPHLG